MFMMIMTMKKTLTMFGSMMTPMSVVLDILVRINIAEAARSRQVGVR